MQRDVISLTVISHPQPGTIVRVDLSQGFKPPEMIKRRPCIVISPPIPGRQKLCTVVPLSTSAPRTKLPHHRMIHLDPPLPDPYSSPEMWVKGDMVLTVAFHRLRLLFSHWDHGQRVYDVRVLDASTLAQVKSCVRHGLGL
jgi:mRNA interferase MazF